MHAKNLLAVAAVVLFPAVASAEPCDGASPFTDVAPGEIYCTNAEWLANRNITLGCGGTSYCPNDAVTRAAMALFMNRLGVVLTPQVYSDAEDSGTIDLDDVNIVCETPGFAAGGYPRRATVSMTFSGVSSGGLNARADLVWSVDDGATWNTMSPGNQFNRVGTSGSNVWVNASQTLGRYINTGDSMRFAIRVERSNVNGGTGEFADSRCFMHVQIGNHNGLMLMFDGTPAASLSEGR